MRLAVQQLLVPALGDGAAHPSQRVAQQLAVPLGERRRADAVRDEPEGRVDAIGEPWSRHLQRAHAGVQPLESARVVGR